MKNSAQRQSRPGKNRKGRWAFLLLIVAVFVVIPTGIILYGTLSQPQRLSVQYRVDAAACLAGLRQIETELQANKPQAEVSPLLVKAKIEVEDFLNKYDHRNAPQFKKALTAALDAYLDLFTVSDIKLPIREGSEIEQTLNARYPEISQQLGLLNEELQPASLIPILRKLAPQRSEAARRALDETFRQPQRTVP